MKYIKTFENTVNESQSYPVELDLKFQNVVDNLRANGIPSEVRIEEFNGKYKVVIVLGWKYPDKLGNAAFAAADAAGLGPNEFRICADSNGGNIIKRSRT